MNAIETRGLRKVYAPPSSRRGARQQTPIVAVDALDLEIREGEFFGLLGPNGAGKTTTIGILTTRIYPTSGEALVAGISVSADPAGVRRRIGVVPQRPNPDRSLSAFENLVFHATYFGILPGEARRRAGELLERLGLAEKRDARVDQLSGGQQQRLMIARALSHEPQVLFLDEPTVGLDPQARLALWDILRDLHRHGRTIVMTTHYMEEADQLCERLGIVDHGKLLALDTPQRLKAQAPGDAIVEVTFDGPAETLVTEALRVEGTSKAEARGNDLRVYSGRGGESIPALIAIGESHGMTVRDIHLSRPSLETLFISLTGRKLE